MVIMLRLNENFTLSWVEHFDYQFFIGVWGRICHLSNLKLWKRERTQILHVDRLLTHFCNLWSRVDVIRSDAIGENRSL